MHDCEKLEAEKDSIDRIIGLRGFDGDLMEGREEVGRLDKEPPEGMGLTRTFTTMCEGIVSDEAGKDTGREGSD
jgi:hypothetical protein